MAREEFARFVYNYLISVDGEVHIDVQLLLIKQGMDMSLIRPLFSGSYRSFFSETLWIIKKLSF